MAQEAWYTRPIFSVSDIQSSLGFYCDLLGFERAWQYEEDQKTIVAQVKKGDFELILAANLDKAGSARVFISLTDPEVENLQGVIKEKQIEVERIHWGYPIIRIKDPDGNEMLFPLDESSPS